MEALDLLDEARYVRRWVLEQFCYLLDCKQLVELSSLMNSWGHIAAVATCVLISTSAFGDVFSFGGTGGGPIPEAAGPGPGAWGPPVQLSFNVTGLSAPISDISLSMTVRYSYLGDLDAVLVPPAASGLSPF